MRTIKLSAAIFAISIFLMACNSNQPPQTTTVTPNQTDPVLTDVTLDDNDYWAKDNLDLQRVGNLLERSENPQQFESYLNSNDGIDNLDLNGDGYADYVSVREYQDRGDNERGLSLFTRYGPNLIQEIATIIFQRDNNRSPGARILLTGNQQIYGDNNYYESNWTDRSVGLISALFATHNNYYSSPYYYDNYPPNYQTYQIVGTPVYRTRIERLYPQPIFVYSTSPTYVTGYKIKSPNNGLHLGQIYAKLAKPARDQEDFIKNNPRGPKGFKADNDDKGGRRDDTPKGIRDDKGGKPDDRFKDDKGGKRDDRSMNDKGGKQNNPSKNNKGGKQNDGSKNDKGGKQNDGSKNDKGGNGGNGKGKGKQ